MPELRAPVVPAGRLAQHAQPTLLAGDIELRAWMPADAAAIAEAYGDPSIQTWHVRSMSESEAASWVASRFDRWRAETGADWAVVADGRVLGRVALRTLDLSEGVGEASYWELPAARGQAVASRALRAMSGWMFETVGLHRIELLHSTANGASCRAATKAGFLSEGTKRQAVRHADGWHDMHLHARLSSDS